LIRASRVRKPAFLSLPRSSALNSQRAREMPCRIAPALDRRHDVEAVVRLGDREGLLDDLLQRLDAAEVLVEAPVVQLELSGAGAKVDAGDRGLSLPGSAVLEGGCRGHGVLAPATG